MVKKHICSSYLKIFKNYRANYQSLIKCPDCDVVSTICAVLGHWKNNHKTNGQPTSNSSGDQKSPTTIKTLMDSSLNPPGDQDIEDVRPVFVYNPVPAIVQHFVELQQTPGQTPICSSSIEQSSVFWTLPSQNERPDELWRMMAQKQQIEQQLQRIEARRARFLAQCSVKKLNAFYFHCHFLFLTNLTFFYRL
jgi:hypothetical protein